MRVHLKAALAMAALTGVAVFVSLASRAGPVPQSSIPKTPAEVAASPFSRSLPLAFVPNQGQWDPEVRFMARRPEMVAKLESDGFVLSLMKREDDQLRGVVLGLRVEDASPEVRLEGEGPLPSRWSWFVGDDPERWAAGVPGFARVRYRGLYEGINLCLREAEGLLEYDLILEPGATLAQVAFRCEGAERLHLDADGALVMVTAAGPIRQKPSITWQESPAGERRPVRCRFRLIDELRYGFVADDLDPDQVTVVDPGLEWSTFLGGSGSELIRFLDQDDAGRVTVAGRTCSWDFPWTPGAYDSSFNGGSFPCDAFVSRLDPSLAGPGQLLWSTFLGGSGSDQPNGISVDPSGVVTVCGSTSSSSNFPTTPGCLQASYGGGAWDAFVVKLSDPTQTPPPQQLLAATYLGGSADDIAVPVVVDESGATTVAGGTGSSNFPVTNGSTFGGGTTWCGDGFLARLDPSLSTLQYATFLGGSGRDAVTTMKRDGAGQLFLSGFTESLDFPTTPGCWDATYNGGPASPGPFDVFVTCLDPNQQLLYSTYLGGSGYDDPTTLDVDPLGSVTVGGWTDSSDFPTTFGAFQTTKSGAKDIFVTRLDPTGSFLSWSTYVGGSADEGANGLKLASGMVTVCGSVSSPDFPVTPGAYDTSFNGGCGSAGCYDAYVLRLDPNQSGASQLVYATYLGGSGGKDYGYYSVALDPTGAATVGGLTSASDFPTAPTAPGPPGTPAFPPYDTSLSGVSDGFVTRLDLHPTGVVKFGASTPSCTGPLAIGVSSWPHHANALFGVTCTGAPPNAPGVLAVSLGQYSPPLVASGVTIYVDVTPGLWFYLPTTSDALGYARIPLPLQCPPCVGLQAYCQYAFVHPPGCGLPSLLCTSNALQITVQ